MDPPATRKRKERIVTRKQLEWEKSHDKELMKERKETKKQLKKERETKRSLKFGDGFVEPGLDLISP